MLRGQPFLARTLSLCVLAAGIACDDPAVPPPAAQTPAVAPQQVATAQDVPELLAQTRQALASGRALDALDLAAQALAIDSTQAEVNNLLATAQSALGRHDEAIASARRAIRHHPNFALAHLNLGGIYFRLQQFDEAEAHLRQAVELEPEQPALYRRLADVYRATQRPVLAIESIRRAQQLMPLEGTFAYLMGLSQEQTGNPDEAIAAYQLATDLDPSMVEAWERIAILGESVDAAAAAAARQHLQRFTSLEATAAGTFLQLRGAVLNSPEDPALHFQLGTFLLENGFAEEGIAKFQHVANMQPGDARLLNHIGGLLSRAEKLDEALPFYMRAADARPDDPTALLNAGSVYAMRGQMDSALPLYAQALERAPDNPQIHYYYGLTLTNAGKTEKAREILQAGLALAGESELTPQFQKILDALGEG